ncbi:MAG: hypothetical protein NXH84_13035 [Rhodobacteraceae bacterium]|jgi:MFS family permease|nr:hypothetical protein [Paracoccaceae bacterium]
MSARGLRTLAGASILAAVLGSVHAFSVFLEPLEAQFGAGRGAVSLTYSGALICLTIAVLFGHRIYGRGPAAWIVLASAGLAAVGALLSAMAGSLPMVWLGYSVLFGAANGLGYGFGLQIAAQVNPGREGVAMGVVTAAYALGSVIAPGLFAAALTSGGFPAAMLGLAGVLIAAGLVSAGLMRGTRFADGAVTGDSTSGGVAFMWLGYFGGVMAGLMVIGHAAGIAAVLAPGQAAWIAPVVIAICNLAGSLIGGRAADILSPRAVLVGLPLLTCVALLALFWLGGPVLLPALGLAGFAYGGTIAAWPPVIAKRVGMDQSARVYGQVFTAWGAAGLAGPWLAGVLFDAGGAYGAALMVAAGLAVVAAATAARIFQPR